MKHRKAASLIIILVAGLLVAPHFLGNIAKENIARQAKLISQIPGYTLQILSYNQGWFTSNAVMRYGFDKHNLNILEKSVTTGSDLDKQILSAIKQGLNFDVTIAHGPVTFQKDIHFALLTLLGRMQDIDHDMYRDFKKHTGISSPLSFFASVSYGGDAQIAAISPSFIFDQIDPRTGKKVTIDFGGTSSEVHINNAQNNYNSIINIPKITLSTQNASISLTGMLIQSSGVKINDDLWLGKGGLSLKELNIKGPNNEVAYSLNNFTSDYDLHKENDTNLSLHWASKLDNFIAPDVVANDILLDIDMNHLDLQGVTQYVKFIRKFYGNIYFENQRSEQENAAMLKTVSHIGEKILNHSPVLVINHLDVSLNGGFIKNAATITFNTNNNGDNSFNIEQLSDPAILNKKLIAQVTITFDHNFALAVITAAMKKQMTTIGVDINSMQKEQLDKIINLQTTTILQKLVTQGYFSQDKEQYSTLFEMKNGQRSINGKILPTSEPIPSF